MAPYNDEMDQRSIIQPNLRWMSGRKRFPNANIRVHTTLNGCFLPMSIDPTVTSIDKYLYYDWNLHGADLPEDSHVTCLVVMENPNRNFAKVAAITVKIKRKAKKQTVLWRATFKNRIKILEGNFEVVEIKHSDSYNMRSIRNRNQLNIAGAVIDTISLKFCTSDTAEPSIPQDEVWEPFETYHGKYKSAKKFGAHMVKVKEDEKVNLRHYGPARVLDF